MAGLGKNSSFAFPLGASDSIEIRAGNPVPEFRLISLAPAGIRFANPGAEMNREVGNFPVETARSNMAGVSERGIDSGTVYRHQRFGRFKTPKSILG